MTRRHKMNPGPECILTIGVYGFNADQFFDTLITAKVDLFCDIRARRGLRGSEYAFANSTRLQARLGALAIPYKHIKSLAPPQAVRDAQQEEDKRAGTKKRLRQELGEAFKTCYTNTCLARIDPWIFVTEELGESRRPLFFCVERSPHACHRSLVADALSQGLDIPVEHLMP
jgi:uncharacterized protein (DUF488 family)